MHPSCDGHAIRVLDTPRGVLVRMPLDERNAGRIKVMAQGDTLLIATEGHVESVRLPRPAIARGIRASHDGGVLMVYVPLDRGIVPSWKVGQREPKPVAPERTEVIKPAKRASVR
jgi:hypothetical protein